MSDEMITIPQLTEKLNCSEGTIRAKIRAKKWPHVKLGPRMVRFTPEQVQGIIDGSMVAAEAPRSRTAQGERIRDLVRQLSVKEEREAQQGKE